MDHDVPYVFVKNENDKMVVLNFLFYKSSYILYQDKQSIYTNMDLYIDTYTYEDV